ncbi:hypothetical protein [Citrobacter koseri]
MNLQQLVSNLKSYSHRLTSANMDLHETIAREMHNRNSMNDHVKVSLDENKCLRIEFPDLKFEALSRVRLVVCDNNIFAETEFYITNGDSETSLYSYYLSQTEELSFDDPKGDSSQDIDHYDNVAFYVLNRLVQSAITKKIISL